MAHFSRDTASSSAAKTTDKQRKKGKILPLPSAPKPATSEEVGLCYRLIIKNSKRDRIIFLLAAGVHVLAALMILFSQPTEAGLLAHVGFRWLLKGLVAKGALSMAIFAFIACALTRPDSKAVATLHSAAKRELLCASEAIGTISGGGNGSPFYAQTPEQLRLQQLKSVALSRFKVACAQAEVRLKEDQAGIWDHDLCPIVMEVLQDLQGELAHTIEQFEIQASRLELLNAAT